MDSKHTSADGEFAELKPCDSGYDALNYLGRAMQDWIISRLAERGSLIVE